jgi:excisionase family DNA binding protein
MRMKNSASVAVSASVSDLRVSAPSPLFTSTEAADFLRLPKTSFLLLVRRGEFAKKRVGKRFLFQRVEIEKFASTGFQKEGVRP